MRDTSQRRRSCENIVQRVNIDLISVADDVSHVPISALNATQPANIPPIIVTDDVSHAPMPWPV